jgi:Fe2+ transport system protein FeoA
MRTLAHLSEGEFATIKRFTDHAVACKLMEMGCLPTQRLVVMRKSAMGNLIYIHAGRCSFAIRHTQAQTIVVE